MVRYVRDETGRFSERPHYKLDEIDKECEQLILSFLKKKHRHIKFPIETEDLIRLIESRASDLDIYADLSSYGNDVEGITEFLPNKNPVVKISAHLSENAHLINRLRTTLTHELGHIHFHSYLFAMLHRQSNLFNSPPQETSNTCKRDSILYSSKRDWMEWQAGYACASMLIPKSHVTKDIQEFRQEKQLFRTISLNEEYGEALIQNTAKKYQTSEEAAKLRLIQLNLLTLNTNSAPLL